MKTKYNRKDLSLLLADKCPEVPRSWEEALALVYRTMEEKLCEGFAIDIFRVGKLIPRNYKNKRIRDLYKDDVKVFDKYTKIVFHTSYTLRKKLNASSKEIERIKPKKDNPYKKKR